jgi:hypothetical protein
MTRIRIELDLDEEYADDSHSSGLNSEGDERLSEALGDFGINLEITKVS